MAYRSKSFGRTFTIDNEAEEQPRDSIQKEEQLLLPHVTQLQSSLNDMYELTNLGVTCVYWYTIC